MGKDYPEWLLQALVSHGCLTQGTGTFAGVASLEPPGL